MQDSLFDKYDFEKWNAVADAPTNNNNLSSGGIVFVDSKCTD